MHNRFDSKIMLNRILDFCEGIDISEFSDMLFVHESPEFSNVHYMPRLSLLIEGEESFKLYEQGRMLSCKLHAPYIYYCTRNGYLWGVKNTGPVHEHNSISFCYLPNYIRISWVYSPTGDAADPKPDRRTGFCCCSYHSTVPLSEGGTALLNTFETLQLQGEKELALRLVRELWKGRSRRRGRRR